MTDLDTTVWDFLSTYFKNMNRDAAHVMVVVGVALIVIGLFLLIARPGAGSAKVGNVEMATGLVVALAGLICIIIPYQSRPWTPSECPDWGSCPTPTPTATTAKPTGTKSPEPTPEPTPTPNPNQVAFRTPSGTFCGTLLSAEEIACVVPATMTPRARSWSKDEGNTFWKQDHCAYWFGLPATGSMDQLNDQGNPVNVVPCPKESDIKELLYGYPDRATTFSRAQYGKVRFKMGSAECRVNEEGTICLNHDDNGFRLAHDKHELSVHEFS